MDPIIGKSLIDGVMGIFGNAQQNRYNRELAEYQNAFNIEMWNRNNEYNSPSATISRLVDAGVNPRAYNQLGQFANASEAPQASTYSTKAPLSAFSDIMRTALEMKNLEAITAKNEAERVKSTTQAATEQAKALDLLSQIEHRSKYSDREEDKLRLSIIDGLRRAWHEGDTINGTGMFNTYMPELTFDQETYGISGLKRISDNANVWQDVLNKQDLSNLREQQKKLNQHDLDFLDSIPKESQWIVKTLLFLLK